MATHFLNEKDNEEVEVLEIVGFVADDPHGAFAEAELQGATCTKCTNTFYSVAVNPDPDQCEWSEEMRTDHRDRMFKALGLEGQPYVAFRHVKNGRTHYHYGISRIQAEEGRAVHLAFDRDKQMMVVREFCRDWGLSMPEGYNKERGQENARDQLLLHEKCQQDASGISREERKALITNLWQRSDSPKAFVSALQDHGYILCTGKRDYVLVDFYGGMNSLPRLIDNKQVRVKQVRDFLGEDFPKEEIPDVEEVRQQIAEHRKQVENFETNQGYLNKKEQLESSQRRRRSKFEQKRSDLLGNQEAEREFFDARQQAERSKLRSQYLAANQEIREGREQRKLQGLAAILARASGYEAVQSRLRRYQDRKRYEVFEADRTDLLIKQQKERHLQELEHRIRLDDIDRRLRSLSLLEKRELRSLGVEHIRGERISMRKGPEHIPRAALELSPWKGRPANLGKAKKANNPRLKKKLARKAARTTSRAREHSPALRAQFREAANATPEVQAMRPLKWQFPGECQKVEIPVKEHECPQRENSGDSPERDKDNRNGGKSR